MSIEEERSLFQNTYINALAIVNDLRKKIDPILKDAIIAEKVLRDTQLTHDEWLVKLRVYGEHGK